MKQEIETLGYDKALKRGGSVYVGWRKDKEDDDLYVRFINKEGKPTRLRLSREAMEALIDGWQEVQKLEKAKESQSYTLKLLIKFLGPITAAAYAGIPPIEDPKAFWGKKFEKKTAWTRVTPSANPQA